MVLEQMSPCLAAASAYGENEFACKDRLSEAGDVFSEGIYATL